MNYCFLTCLLFSSLMMTNLNINSFLKEKWCFLSCVKLTSYLNRYNLNIFSVHFLSLFSSTNISRKTNQILQKYLISYFFFVKKSPQILPNCTKIFLTNLKEGCRPIWKRKFQHIAQLKLRQVIDDVTACPNAPN